MKNREDAEEVAQDVLLKAVRKIDAFRGDAALSSWLCRFIHVQHGDVAAANAKAARASEAYEDSLDAGLNGEPATPREVADWSSLADEQVMRSQMRRRLMKAVLELLPIYRVPVVRYIQGLTTEEASAVLNVRIRP